MRLKPGQPKLFGKTYYTISLPDHFLLIKYFELGNTQKPSRSLHLPPAPSQL